MSLLTSEPASFLSRDRRCCGFSCSPSQSAGRRQTGSCQSLRPDTSRPPPAAASHRSAAQVQRERLGPFVPKELCYIIYLPAASVQIESSSTGWGTMVMSSAYLKSVSGYCRLYCLNPLDLSHLSVRWRAHRKRLERGAKPWNVLGRTFCRSCLSRPVRFVAATLARSLWSMLSVSARDGFSCASPRRGSRLCQLQRRERSEDVFFREKRLFGAVLLLLVSPSSDETGAPAGWSVNHFSSSSSLSCFL